MATFTKWIHRVNGDVTDILSTGPIPPFHVDSLLIEQYPDAIYVLDTNGRLIDSNEKMGLLFDDFALSPADAEEFAPYHEQALTRETVHPDDWERLTQAIQTSRSSFVFHPVQTCLSVYVE